MYVRVNDFLTEVRLFQRKIGPQMALCMKGENMCKKNYQVFQTGPLSAITRAVLHQSLNLTGSEISINQFKPGTGYPFVHAHKRNEEVYIFIGGSGTAYIDGEEFPVREGDAIRIDPGGKRCFKADTSSPLFYICVQTEKNSLIQHTRPDGILCREKPSWLK
jgi:mannose-6-phosphate isomerase-like protein (cupin superfamily)